MKKIFIYLTVFLAVVGALALIYTYNKPHRSVSDEEALQINAVELFNSFQANEAKANELFLNKALEVTGEVGEILKDAKGNYVIIMKGEDDFFGVKVSLMPDQTKTAEKCKEGDMATIKGICTGGGGGLDVEIVRGIIRTTP